MRRLTSQDAMFLAVEDQNTVVSVSALTIVEGTREDGTPLTRDHIAQLVQERLHLLAPLRWTLAPVPFKLGHPTWIDGDVDIDFHVRELGLPPPGDQATLETLVARLAVHPFDRSRPLWELYVIDGLQDGKVALLTKFHHAAVDGLSGAEIMGLLFDRSPEGRKLPSAPKRQPERRPGQTTLMVRGAASSLGQVKEVPRIAVQTVSHIDQNPFARSIPGTARLGELARRSQFWQEQDPRLLDTPRFVAPHTRFNQKVGKRRTFCMVTLPLGSVKALKNHHNATVNDVIIAITAGALRRWLGATGDLPDDPLVGLIPISVRSPQGSGAFGNAVGGVPVRLPTDEPDAVQRLIHCRDELRDAKERWKAVPASLIRDSTDLIPPMLYGQAMRNLLSIGANPNLDPIGNLIISNVPGPPIPMYCAGAKVVSLFPVSALGGTLGLNVTIFSYQDQLNIGLLSDTKQVPDLADFGQALRDELDQLLQESGISQEED
jgi:diacylglycerol O-acyltransferase